MTFGSSYIFERQPNGTWPQAAKLVASDADSIDSFGMSVTISGDYAAAGAWLDEGTTGNGTGSAYAFERQPDGTWLEVAKLEDPEGASGDHFGFSIDSEGDAILVGAIHDNISNSIDAGSAHLFVRDGAGVWDYRGRIVSEAIDKDDNFGHSVALSGGHLVVGSSNDDEFIDNGGSVQIRYSYGASGATPPLVHGTGTAGCSGNIGLNMTSAPIVGNAAFGFAAQLVDPLSIGTLTIADGANLAGADPLGLGATVYVDILSPFLLFLPIAADAAGVASLSVPIPNDPALVGLELNAQGLWLGQSCGIPAATSNLVGFELLGE